MKPIAYMISSHFSYCTLALPRLLKSLRNVGIPRENIFVVLCGCQREFDQQGPECTFWYVSHESRNFCTFVEAVNPARAEALSRFDHMFQLMDTCLAHPKFAELSADFDRNLDAVGITPFRGPDLTLSDFGAYRLEYVRSHTQLINDVYRNVTHDHNCDYEGKMYGMADPARRGFYSGTNDPRFTILETAKDVYGTGTLRQTELYTAVDLVHYKSNWGQNGRRLLDRV